MLSLLWSLLSFVLGIVWAVVWLVLRDLLSTLLWVLIIVWLVLGVRYRSFSAAAFVMLRYGRRGLVLFWRWLRGRPVTQAPPFPEDGREMARGRMRRPFGTMSISEQLNMLLVASIWLLIFA